MKKLFYVSLTGILISGFFVISSLTICRINKGNFGIARVWAEDNDREAGEDDVIILHDDMEEDERVPPSPEPEEDEEYIEVPGIDEYDSWYEDEAGANRAKKEIEENEKGLNEEE